MTISKPIEGNVTISSGFGGRGSIATKAGNTPGFHDGMDISCPQGTPVYNIDAGKVKFAGTDQFGGAYIDIVADSDGGLARYLHLSRIDVKTGQWIATGQQIGLSGGQVGTWGAGLSTGPHLHLGLFIKGQAVNPAVLLGVWKDPSTFKEKPSEIKPPVQERNPDLLYLTVAPGEGISQVLKRAGYSEEAYSSSDEWARFTELNGVSKLTPGQEVKVYKTLKVKENKPIIETPMSAQQIETIKRDHNKMLCTEIMERAKKNPIYNENDLPVLEDMWSRGDIVAMVDYTNEIAKGRTEYRKEIDQQKEAALQTLQQEALAIKTQNEELKKQIVSKNSANKPFYESKKVGVTMIAIITAILPYISIVDPYISDDLKPFWAIVVGIINGAYQIAQGQIDKADIKYNNGL